MHKQLTRLAFGLIVGLAGPAATFAAAQQPIPPAPKPAPQAPTQPAQAPAAPAAPATVAGEPVYQCGQPVPAPAKMPPAGSAPIVLSIAPCFEKQGGTSVIDPATYLFYIQVRPSRPSADVWVPYNEQDVLEDFKRLWGTNFLDDLSIDVRDYPFSNGVTGKLITYNMEERQRVKIVDYEGSKKLDQTKIDEKLKEEGVTIRLDTFIDPGMVRRVEGIVRGMLAEKGYQFATVTHDIKPMPGGPKLVHLTFKMEEGPKVKIRSVDFDGNKAMSDGTLKGKMKDNKAPGMFAFITGAGTYQEAKFEDDADKITEFYRTKGYITARVGQPELKYLEDSKDGKTRWIQLRIPITEGDRYRVGSLEFDGNKVVQADALRPLFKLKEGDFYNENHVRKGLMSAREVYGTGGYWEFTGYPDLKPRNLPPQDTPPDKYEEAKAVAAKQPPIVDVTMRLQEGEQYFVNRITFVGNTTTRDNVVRREMRLLENGVFNTEALKYSVKRINQLGYFKQLEEGNQETIKVEKTAGQKNKVDVTLQFEEQNRNQLTFGAGVSQFEGFFGQLSFQTSNFLGRGESVTFAILAGARAKQYQLAFSEPFLFDRPINAGIDIYNREIKYYYAYTQKSTGGNVAMGFRVRNFTSLFMTYSLEQARVTDIDELFLSPEIIARNPFLADALLISEGGKRTISKIAPSFVHNTVDNPIFPNSGKRLTATIDFAGIGGNTNFIKPRLEGVWYLPLSRRMTVGLRAQGEYIRPYGSTLVLPIFERLFQGGEYSIRGYDIRTIGPRDIGTPEFPGTFVVIGGTKSLLFNAEYQIAIAGPVRVLPYFDAGQVRDQGQKFEWNEFVASTGVEVRFFMPVLNVPFRLIYAYNINRDGILDNNLQQTKANVFKFAVGSTF
jgi:outer membrane protein insertion porin family